MGDFFLETAVQIFSSFWVAMGARVVKKMNE